MLSLVSAVPLNQFFDSDVGEFSLASVSGSSSSIDCENAKYNAKAVCQGTCPKYCSQTKYANTKACLKCNPSYCSEVKYRAKRACEGTCQSYCSQTKYANTKACLGCSTGIDCKDIKNKNKLACEGTCQSYCDEVKNSNTKACLKCNPSYCSEVKHRTKKACESTCQSYCSEKKYANTGACVGCGLYVDCTNVVNRNKNACKSTCQNYCSQAKYANTNACLGCNNNVVIIGPGPTPEPEIACTDSDGGENYYEKGVGEGLLYDLRFNKDESGRTSNNYRDLCYDKGNNVSIYPESCDNCGVYELSCIIEDSKEFLYRTYYECPNGCKNGACVEAEGPEDPIEVPECTNNNDCGVGKVCTNNECVNVEVPEPVPTPTLECTNNDDCGVGKVCAYNKCVNVEVPEPVPEPECRLNTDCGAGKMCNKDGKCIDIAIIGKTNYCGDGVCDEYVELIFYKRYSEEMTIILDGIDYDISHNFADDERVRISVNGITSNYLYENQRYIVNGLPVYINELKMAQYAGDDGYISIIAGEHEKTCPTDCVAQTGCKDSDGGINDKEQGVVTFDKDFYHDKCVVSKLESTGNGFYVIEDGIEYVYNNWDHDGCAGNDCSVAEAYCTNTGSIDFDVIPCDYGCLNGACNSKPPVDVTAPQIINSGPFDSHDSSVTLSIETNEKAICDWSEDGIIFNQMQYTDGLYHSQSLFLGLGTTYQFYIKCRDYVGNMNPEPYQMSIDIYPPEEEYECYVNDGICTSAVRGCGHNAELDYACPGLSATICCEEVPYCGDGVCFEHEIGGYGETPKSCPRDCDLDGEIDRCSELRARAIAGMTNYINDGRVVVIKEGEKIYEDQYFVVADNEGGRVFELDDIDKFTDINPHLRLDDKTYGENDLESSIKINGTEGYGTFRVAGEKYYFTVYYNGSDSRDERYITISDSVQGISNYNCAIENAHPYMVLQDFPPIKPNLESLEEGIEADGIDTMSTIFPDFLNGASMLYSAKGEGMEVYANSGVIVAVAEYEDAISFKDFERNFVNEMLLSQNDVQLDYDSVPEGLGIENAQVLFAENRYEGQGNQEGDLGAYWISQNKFIVFYIEDMDKWQYYDDDEALEDLLEAYLIKHPSTLVEEPTIGYCGDGECVGSESVTIIGGEIESGPYNGRHYEISVASIGANEAELIINGISIEVHEGESHDVDGLYFHVNDILLDNPESPQTRIAQIRLTIGEDERSCSADCGIIPVYSPLIQRDIGELIYQGMDHSTNNCEIMEEGGDSCELWVAEYNYPNGNVGEVIAAAEIQHKGFTNDEFINSMANLAARGGYKTNSERINGNNIFVMNKDDGNNPEIESYVLVWYNDDMILGIVINDWNTDLVDDDIFEGLLEVYLNKYPSDLELNNEIPEPEVPCKDDDGGRNIYEQGRTTGIDWSENEYTSRQDYCIEEGEKAGRLNEFYCSFKDGAYRVRSETFGPENGCEQCINGKCIAGSGPEPEPEKECPQIGLRREGQYCDFDYEWTNHIEEGDCNNNFECTSNACLDGGCLPPGFWKKVFAWLDSIMG